MSTIPHTITRRGQSWQPSMGGLGEVCSEEITRVRWDDPAETTLVVVGTEASVTRFGKRIALKPVSGNHDAIVNHWLPRIQRRLEVSRLADRVRVCLTPDDVSERLQAWNAELASQRNA